MPSFQVQSHERNEMQDITPQLRRIVQESELRDGLCEVFVMHTTAGVTINENADPDVVTDLLMMLEKLAPPNRGYRHMEGNSDSHLKSSLVGCSERVLVQDGKLVLGTWQSVYFCEFDGPRNRTVQVQLIPGLTE